MSALAIARPRRTGALAVALCALAGALASLAVMSLLPGGGETPARPFKVATPAGWTALSAAQLAALPSRPAAVLRRADHRGLVVIRPTAPVQASGARLVHDLGARLRPRFSGFRAIGARFTNVRGGRAFVYTFERNPARTAQTVALVTAGGRSYEIDAIVPANAPAAARDAAAIIASFGS